MTDDLQLLPNDKDTSKSCVFDFPDRPVESLPPNYPPIDPGPDYPYTPTDDWPYIPPEERPVPGSDPDPGPTIAPPHDDPVWHEGEGFSIVSRASLQGTALPNPIDLRDLHLGSMDVPGDDCSLYHDGFTLGLVGSSEADCLTQLESYATAHGIGGARSCGGLFILTRKFNEHRLFYMCWYGKIFPATNVLLPCNILYDLSFTPLPNTEELLVKDWIGGFNPQVGFGETVLARWHQLSNPSQGFSWRIL